VEAIIKNKKLNIGDRYFVSDGNGGYKAYTGTTPPENEKLYELVTEYMITAGDDDGFPKVTGQYKVCATNSLGNNTTEEMPSTVCQLVSPDNVVITTDLADKLVLSETVSQNVLKVATKKQTYNIEPVYAWYKNTKSASKEGASLIAGATSANYTPTEPGWYMVNCSVDLNREPKDADSKICKVTNKATLPDVDYGTEAKKYLETYDGNVKIPTYMDGKDATLDLAVSKYAPDANHAEELYSDGLTYEWHVKIGESGADRPVKESDTFLKGGLGTPTL
jgi:hypothetical protein